MFWLSINYNNIKARRVLLFYEIVFGGYEKEYNVFIFASRCYA